MSTSCMNTKKTFSVEILEFGDLGIEFDVNKVGFDIGESFEKDEVTIVINGQQLYSKIISNKDDGTGWADYFEFPKSNDLLQVEISINNSDWEGEINLSNGSFLCLMYVRGQVTVEQEKYPIPLD